MKRLGVLLLVMVLMVSALGAARVRSAVPETLVLPAPTEGWADSYLDFLSSNYDIFAALWPYGVGGMGFIDLDLDGTPELVVFDQGASAALGAHLFDLVNGQVYCVSSVLDSAEGAFGGSHFSPVSVCTSFFEAFRLSRTATGWCFWIDSANGTMESAWDEFVRFDCVDGVLTPVSVCARYLECDVQTGYVVDEEYTVSGGASNKQDYDAASNAYLNAMDVGYQPKGVFMWDGAGYSVSQDGFMSMARDAAAAYIPIVDTVALASVAG